MFQTFRFDRGCINRYLVVNVLTYGFVLITCFVTKQKKAGGEGIREFVTSANGLTDCKFYKITWLAFEQLQVLLGYPL
ncbi:hypothetical protein Phum_PHUM511960 [Pediculus humanus corporis]|uniref:Uncharacterized protein n=1 Tax=Pediculus humanus subsp. corporis TaxID=121224 RepID=E0VY97_PEDHC|nr:uncharacterized protein Phum_PHUM511960 [Pediculus humanus corporis]EEB18353.1 hypothetical protein Phum_PHUM511960 [Pediculus humanus corporis]